MTNREKFLSELTSEELAKMLILSGKCQCCIHDKDCTESGEGLKTCYCGTLQWLNKEEP